MDSPCFKFLNQNSLPLIIQARNQNQANIDYLLQFLKGENAAFKAQLLDYGAILFRGFNIFSAEHLSLMIDHCNLGTPHDYGQGLIPRTKITNDVHRITHPRETAIPMHNEKSYSKDFPHHVYFNCIRAATEGGNTPLADAHKVWLSLPEALQLKLRTKGILYHKFYYGPGIKQKYAQLISRGIDCETWMNAFQTDCEYQLGQFLEQSKIQYRWSKRTNGLLIEHKLPAYHHHPINNRIVWFNQSNVMNYYHNYIYGNDKLIKHPIFRLMLPPKRFLTHFASFGDGEPISKSDAHLIHHAIQRNQISIPWQEGDVMVIDNFLCLHGKEPHRGERLLFVGMTQ